MENTTTTQPGYCFTPGITYYWYPNYYPPQPPCYKCKCDCCCYKESCANRK